MSDHFAEMMEARVLPPLGARSLAQRLTAATAEWHEVEKILRSYSQKRTPINGATLFIALSRALHELIDDPHLHARLLQHLEQELKKEFPAPPGTLFSA